MDIVDRETYETHNTPVGWGDTLLMDHVDKMERPGREKTWWGTSGTYRDMKWATCGTH